MEKILLAIGATNPDYNSFEFACYLPKITHSKITAIFLENMLEIENMLQVRLRRETNSVNDVLIEEASDKRILIEKNIKIIKDRCEQKKINFNIHRDRGVPLFEIIEETRFADVLIIDVKISFKKRHEGLPTEFVSSILKKAECPTVIAPENFEEVNEIIFSYANTNSSLFALKQSLNQFLLHISKTKFTINEKNYCCI